LTVIGTQTPLACMDHRLKVISQPNSSVLPPGPPAGSIN